jgi:hypothetical protein
MICPRALNLVTRWAAVAIVYFAITLVMATSFVDLRQIASLSFGADGRLIVWTIAWATRAIREHLPLFAANMYFPTPDALAYTEHMLGLGLLALPLSFVTSNPALVYMLLWLAAFWTNALAAHLLAYRFTRRHDASLAAGLIFGWTFFRMSHAGHLQLQWTAWMPLSLWLLERWMQRPTWPRLTWLVAATLMQMLTSWYTAVLEALLVASWFAWMLVTSHRLRLPQHGVQIVVASAIGAVVLVPLARPYVRAHAPEPAASAAGLSADLRTYLAPPEDTWLGQQLEHRFGMDARWIWGEQTLFLGWIAVALAVLGAIDTGTRSLHSSGEDRRDARVVLFFVALAILGVWLSLGPAGGPYSPFGLMNAIPGVALFRAPARFALLVMLAVAVLAAAGLARSLEEMEADGSRRFVSPIVAVIAVLMLVEWRVVTPIMRAEPLPVPAIYDSLTGLPPGAVMSLPDYSAGPEWFYSADYLLFATSHWRPIVNGYGRSVPAAQPAIIAKLSAFPSADAAALARTLGVRYFIVHTGRLHSTAAAEAAQRSPDFTLRAAIGPDYLFEVRTADTTRR